jgi:hypothetical protein
MQRANKKFELKKTLTKVTLKEREMFKRLRALTASAVLLMMAHNANAISLNFKFKTFSSGPEIYACNAGLRHEDTKHQVCYFENTQTACTPQACTGNACDTRCVCTGIQGGEYLMDYMSASYNRWNAASTSNDGGFWSSTWTAVNKQAGHSNYETLVNHTDAFGTRIKNLSFKLGSELYGAEYFVDVCFKGPQMEYSEDGITTNFSLLAQASATDFISNSVNYGDDHPYSDGFGDGRKGLTMNPSGIKYTKLADLSVQAVTICDVQGSGKYQTSNVGDEYNTLANEAIFNNWNNAAAGGPSSEFNAQSSVTTIGAASDLINTSITSNSTSAPRFCRIRYIFKENNGAADSTFKIKNLRKWQRHGAEMCTYTKIEENSSGADDSGDNWSISDTSEEGGSGGGSGGGGSGGGSDDNSGGGGSGDDDDDDDDNGNNGNNGNGGDGNNGNGNGNGGGNGSNGNGGGNGNDND